ncbi:hypothetical protein C8F01DRAFT_1105106 [Mycena amicta]|nr:hypothetical protein C8F01DRAFT_1105106 [Mycena amicta]
MDSHSESPSPANSAYTNDPLRLVSSTSASSNYSLTTPSGFRVPSAQALIREMQSKLQQLDETLGELHGQTMQTELLGGESQIAKDIENLRAQLRNQDKNQREGIQEVELILGNVLNTDAIELMKRRAEESIAREIDQLVEEQVAARLKLHIPDELQDEVAKQEKYLEEIRRDLHNSESRRANAMLRSDSADDAEAAQLQAIYKADGTLPAKFPTCLKDLFDMDVSTSEELMKEYELADRSSNSRERNLNRLMHFFNVKYQLVREGAATRSLGML